MYGNGVHDVKGNRRHRHQLSPKAALVACGGVIFVAPFVILLFRGEDPTPPVIPLHPASALPGAREGVIVLGMHRSGTSMLTGLLARAGLNLGTQLIEPKDENAKGYFEKAHVVFQNDLLLRDQKTNWSDSDIPYDLKSLSQHFKDGSLTFKYGEHAIAELESADLPWVMKDPRLCVTLRSWLPMLRQVPAVVFTYRHPLEVCASLVARSNAGGQQWKMKRVLRLWTAYQKRGVAASQDLCRVVTSNKRVVSDPVGETNRIIEALRSKCGVAVPQLLSDELVTGFIDVSMQHKTTVPEPVAPPAAAAAAGSVERKCVIPPPTWVLPTAARLKAAEVLAYEDAMRVYCDLESGAAFASNYMWPPHRQD